jgi:hypothetical protein
LRALAYALQYSISKMVYLAAPRIVFDGLLAAAAPAEVCVNL